MQYLPKLILTFAVMLNTQGKACKDGKVMIHSGQEYDSSAVE